jgi:ribonuclease HI
MSRCVWALTESSIVEHISLTAEPSARQWLFEMMKTLSQAEFVRMVVTLWALWHARRKVIHESIYQSPLSTHSFIEAFIKDLGESETKKEKVSGGAQATVPRWLSPPVGQYKINTDGAVAKTRCRGSVSAVCWSPEGAFLGASAVVYDGITDPGCLEAMACRESLALAADLNIGDVKIASDCMEVVQGLTGSSLGRFSHIIREVQTTARRRGGVSFRHEGRKSNTDAHNLARMATTLSAGRHVWLGLPPVGFTFHVMREVHAS